MVNNQCIIIYKTGHKKGKRHDYNSCRYKNNHPATPENIANVNVFDLGYLGVEKDYPNRHHHSQRERKWCESIHRGKEYNQYHAKKRMDMEHNMCRIKNQRIVSDTFRNRSITTGYRI